MPLARNWPGWSDLPAGFEILEHPGTAHAERACIELRGGYTIFTENDRSSRSQALYSTRIKELWDWATRNNYALLAYRWSRPIITAGTPPVAVRGSRVPTLFFICADTPDDRQELAYQCGDGWLTEITFRCYCGQDHQLGTFVCPTLNELVSCPACDSIGVRTSIVSGSVYTCTSCGQGCGHPGCDEVILRAQRGRPQIQQYCSTHASHASCSACGLLLEWGGSSRQEEPVVRTVQTVGLDGRSQSIENRYCESCAPYICPGCGAYSESDLQWSSHHNANVCTECRRGIFRLTGETFEEGTLEIGTLKTVAGRENIRKCGVEIEGANGTAGGTELAQKLYALGYTTARAMVEHHSGDSYGVVHVERDSSVDWECVIGPLNMAEKKDAQILNTTVKTIRDMVRTKHLTLDLRCGLHIHVSAERVGLAQAYNLSHLFTYLEDPLFRIGAARWPYHRASQGSHYCAPIPKYERKLDFYQQQGGRAGGGRTNHYFALSFNNYFHAKMRNCGCGAVAAGVWDECTCPGLGKCTFEFRLFNTTANPRKILAYLALSQALVAKAMSMDEIKSPNKTFPGLEFNQQVFKEMAGPEADKLVEAWKPRLKFILEELPMTPDERDAVIYCIKNCEIATGVNVDDFLVREVAV